MRRRLPRRLVFLVIAIFLGVLFGRWLARRPSVPTATPPPPVAIEDGKTIDFSSGRPVIQDDTATLEVLRELYPLGELTLHESEPWWQSFWVYFVPAQ